MHGSCNHFAGMLFQVENAVKTGETKTFYSDKLSNWNNKKGKGALKPLKAVEVVWRKGHYTKNIGDAEEEKEKQELQHKLTPLNKRQK